jgi:hypothetical protein
LQNWTSGSNIAAPAPCPTNQFLGGAGGPGSGIQDDCICGVSGVGGGNVITPANATNSESWCQQAVGGDYEIIDGIPRTDCDDKKIATGPCKIGPQGQIFCVEGEYKKDADSCGVLSQCEKMVAVKPNKDMCVCAPDTSCQKSFYCLANLECKETATSSSVTLGLKTVAFLALINVL